VPTLSGRLGMESHDGRGTAGVLVSSKNDVNRIGGTQSRWMPTLTLLWWYAPY
jgi:hypothetical protein